MGMTKAKSLLEVKDGRTFLDLVAEQVHPQHRLDPEHVDRAVAGGVLLAPAAALHDLGALVLGDHALDLQQQVLLGSVAGGVAEEDDLDAATGELLQD